MKSVSLFLCSVLLSIAATAVDAADDAPFVSVKRSALWVPDLDRAVVFFRDVLGFTVDAVGKLEPNDDSVLLDLFNTSADKVFRRALFSSSTDERALFVMEAEGAPTYTAKDQRHSVLIIRTDDLASVVARAKEHGFVVGNTNFDTSAGDGNKLRETTIVGPAGQAVLVYQLITSKPSVHD